MDSVNGKTIEEMAKRDVCPGVEIRTDSLKAYNKLE
jgi:hypothetical protein